MQASHANVSVRCLQDRFSPGAQQMLIRSDISRRSSQTDCFQPINSKGHIVLCLFKYLFLKVVYVCVASVHEGLRTLLRHPFKGTSEFLPPPPKFGK